MKSEDRPSFAQNPFYSDASKTDAELMYCRQEYFELVESTNDVINSELANLDIYPNEPSVLELISRIIMFYYNWMVDDLIYSKNGVTLQQVIDSGNAIINKIGEVIIDEQKVTDKVTLVLAQVSLCSDSRFSIPNANIGTSDNKRVE